MNIKTTLFLFGALLVMLGIFAAMQLCEVLTPEEREDKERFLLPSLNDKFTKVTTSDFTRVTIERAADGKEPAVRFEFEKENKEWRLVAPKRVRTDTSAVTRVIDQLMTARKEKTDKLKPNLADHGLDQPRVTLTLYRGDKETIVKLGQDSPGKDPVVYVVTSDAPKQPAVVAKSAIDKAFAALADFRDKKLFGSSFDVQALRLAPAGQQAMEFEKVERDWRFREPKLGEADGKGVDDLNLNVTGIAVEKTSDFVADGPFDAATLAKYGLTKDKASAITVRRKSPEDPKKTVEETLLIGAKDPEVVNRAQRDRAARFIGDVAASALASVPHLQAREKEDKDVGGYFAKLADDQTIVRIDAKHLKLLEKKADDLRSRQLAKIDAQKADAINLTSAGETLRLRRPRLKVEGGAVGAPSEWDLYTDTRAKTKTHLDVVPRLIDALNKIELTSAKSFLDDTAKQREWFGTDTIDFGLDKPQAEIHVWLDSLKRDKDGKPEGDGEPKLKDDAAKKPHLKLAIGRKDEKRGVVYVRRQFDDGDVAILAVPDPFISGAAPPPPQQFGQPPRPDMRETVSLTEKATAGYMAFRDHTLPSFTLTNATKLTLHRGGATYEAIKEEKKDDKGAVIPNWLLKKPVEGKSQGVDLLLSQLSSLSADKLITDRATERDLKEVFGLADQPLLKAVVTVTDKDDKKKSGDYTYVIGKKTSAEGKHANHFYVRIEVKPAEGAAPDTNQFVFVLPWYAVQGLDGELRDSTVFEEEKSAKPVEVTLVWNKPDKDKKMVETRLVLAHQPEKEGSAVKVWSVQSLTVGGKDAKADLPKLDADKVEQLLGTASVLKFGPPRVSPLRTPHFVVHNGKPDPKHRLDAAKKDAPPMLAIELKYDSKAVRSLTLGEKWEPKDTEFPGLHPKAYYFASASSLPNAVFVVEEATFKPLIDGVEFFKATEKVAENPR